MVRDFTMAKYGELCRVLLGAGYTPVTVEQYLTGLRWENRRPPS
jgi:hypothetical protein